MSDGPQTFPLPSFERVEHIQAHHLEAGLLSCVVFGPGDGEAIVVVLPDGQVGVVDGCAELKNHAVHQDPVSALLRDIAHQRGLMTDPPALELAFVCLTHPHRDHYKGLAALVKTYGERIQCLARPRIVAKEHSQKWLEWVKFTYELPAGPHDDFDLRGLTELLDVWDTAFQEVAFCPLSTGMTLLRKKHQSHELIVEGCGPSGNDEELGLKLLAADLQEMKDTGARQIRNDANATSGALVVQYGRAQVLLAGDLIHRDEKNSSWNRAARQACFQQPVQVVNVAHHASHEAHHPTLWRQMAPQLAIVTPYKHASKNQPPRPKMIETLLATSRVVITSPPRWEPEALAGFEQLPARELPVPAEASFLPQPIAGNSRMSAHAPARVSGSMANAVAFSLNASGQVTRVLLAGEAAEYVVKGDKSP